MLPWSVMAHAFIPTFPAVRKWFDLNGAVEKAVVGVKMKVNERFALRHH
jgi:hypothetical protein